MGGINVIPGLVDVGNSNFGSECVCGNNVLILSLVDVSNSINIFMANVEKSVLILSLVDVVNSGDVVDTFYLCISS